MMMSLIGVNDMSNDDVSNMNDKEALNPMDETLEKSSMSKIIHETTLMDEALGPSIPRNLSDESSLLSTPNINVQTANESKPQKPSLEASMVANTINEPINSRVSTDYFVNRIMTTREPVNSSCHRACVDFRNRIYFSPPVGDPGAGLIDRLTIFGTMLNMAGYLCARVYAPRPKFLLGVRHNANQTLDANMSWSEFGDFVLWNDPQRQPALLDWDNPDDVNEWPDPESLLNISTGLLRLSMAPRQVKFDFTKFERFTNAQQAKLKQNESAGDGFIWSIRAEYFEWSIVVASGLRRRSLPNHLHLPTVFAEEEYIGCQYAKVGLTRSTRELQEKITQQILRQPDSFSQSSLPPLVGYLHVRRQDTKILCKTHIWKMWTFLHCSLNDTITRLSELSARQETQSQQSMIVLFSSDDDDPLYRGQILKMIEQQQASPSLITNTTINVTAVDFDEVVNRTIRMEIQTGGLPARRLNNFHIFQLILSIGYNQSVVKFHLERRRRGLCKPCVNVTDQLIKSGVFGSNGYPTELKP